MSEPYNVNNFPPYEQNMYYHLNSVINERRNKKREIRKLSNCIGGAVLCYLLLQNVLSLFVPALGLLEYYQSSEIFRKGVDILLLISSILPSFMLFGRLMKKISGNTQPLSFAKPKAGLTVLAIFSGMGICMLGNFATAFFSVFMAIFGYELYAPESTLPHGVMGIAATVVQIVFVAALIEEISLRGHTMGNLRKYGDGFAIFVSSLVFAIMHGNLVQAPFALVAGFGLGYFCVKLNSLWPSILIHAGNNLLSVVVSYIGEFYGDEAVVKIYYPMLFLIIALGIICFIAFIRLTKNEPIKKGDTALSFSEKFMAFASSPAIIIAFIIMLVITASYIVPIQAG